MRTMIQLTMCSSSDDDDDDGFSINNEHTESASISGKVIFLCKCMEMCNSLYILNRTMHSENDKQLSRDPPLFDHGFED